MSWNNRSKVAAMGVAIQTTPGQFVLPNETSDLMAVASLSNADAQQSVADPTLTGAVWDTAPIVLGSSSTIGGSVPLRGPGGDSPPALGAWPPGRILQAAGFTEQRLGVSLSSVLQAGSSTTSLILDANESAIDDFLFGTPIQTANLGTGFRQTSLVRYYSGANRGVALAERMGAAPAAGVAYTRPASLTYVLGTLAVAPPLLSISVFRDKKRYDYRDCALTSFAIDAPVANEANQVFPSLDFQLKGIAVGEYDDITPSVPSAVLSTPVAPVRGGKFDIYNTMIGHQDMKVTLGLTTGAASNQNQDAGQDGYDIQSGTRTIDLDLNEMATTDLALTSLINAQTIMHIMSTWGLGLGNRHGLITRNVLLQPQALGDRNGYVNRTGQASPTDPDKAIAYSIWWD